MATPTTAQAVRALLARRSDIELSFVQHRETGVVHVITPVDPTTDQPVQRVDADSLLSWAIGATPTLCGYLARRHLGGLDQGDQAVGEFDTQLLCRSCHRVLGEHAYRIFEQLPPDPDGALEHIGDVQPPRLTTIVKGGNPPCQRPPRTCSSTRTTAPDYSNGSTPTAGG